MTRGLLALSAAFALACGLPTEVTRLGAFLPTPTQPWPSAAPAAICDDAELLRGPATAPAGAVSVFPGSNLSDATNSAAAGTVFWLAPGRHTVGTGEFDQVIPKEGNVYVGAPGAILDGQGLNRYAFAGTSPNVTIRYLTVEGFIGNTDEGVVNHDSGNGWTIEYSTLRNNGGAALMAGARNTLRYNCLADSGQYALNAFQAGDGIVDLVIDHNEIRRNNTAGHGTPLGGQGGALKLWTNHRVKVTHNWIHDNRGFGVAAENNTVELLVEGNLFEDNDSEALAFSSAYNAMVRFNTFRRNAQVLGKARGADPFPIAAVYLAESGGATLDGYASSTFEVHGNLFEDNWNEVVLWEDADRYCNGPNSGSGACTLAATLDQCQSTSIVNSPYYDTCRWKTQNVSVHDNHFVVDLARMGCTAGLACGRVGLFSNVASGAGSPYSGDVIQQAITFTQNNRFSANTYRGEHQFVPFEVGRLVDFATWQSAPYSQDSGSRLEP